MASDSRASDVVPVLIDRRQLLVDTCFHDVHPFWDHEFTGSETGPGEQTVVIHMIHVYSLLQEDCGRFHERTLVHVQDSNRLDLRVHFFVCGLRLRRGKGDRRQETERGTDTLVDGKRKSGCECLRGATFCRLCVPRFAAFDDERLVMQVIHPAIVVFNPSLRLVIMLFRSLSL